MKSPSFIDLHTHGIGRYDTRTSDPDDILRMARLHLEAGTTAFLPTIYSGTIKQMRANMEAVKEAIIRQHTEDRTQIKTKNNSSLVTRHSSLILGVHLEGPFLNPLRCGAQDRDSFIKPTISNLQKLIEGYEDIIRIITVAPELPGALKVIERCVSMGIKVNMGHSEATYKQALNGKKAGATGISHIFNAMRPFHHREPGLAGFGLIDEDIYIEVIADGIHLNINTLKLILSIKRPERIIFVSDSIKGAGQKRPSLKRQDKIIGGLMSLSKSLENLKNSSIFVKGMDRFVYENPKRYLHKCLKGQGFKRKNTSSNPL